MARAEESGENFVPLTLKLENGGRTTRGVTGAASVEIDEERRLTRIVEKVERVERPLSVSRHRKAVDARRLVVRGNEHAGFRRLVIFDVELEHRRTRGEDDPVIADEPDTGRAVERVVTFDLVGLELTVDDVRQLQILEVVSRRDESVGVRRPARRRHRSRRGKSGREARRR